LINYGVSGDEKDMSNTTKQMVRARYVVAGVLLVTLAAYAADTAVKDDRAPLPTGHFINPAGATTSEYIGSMPLNMVVSPDGKYLITTGDGSASSLCAVRVSDGGLASYINFGRGQQTEWPGLYYGLAFGSDGKLYAAQGGSQCVVAFKLGADGTLVHDAEIDGAATDFPAGIAADARGHIYVTQNDPVHARGDAFGTPASVSIIDIATKKEAGRYVFADPLGLSNFPLAVTVNDDGSRLYVGSQRDSAVYVLDASNPAKVTLVQKLNTGSHPNALLLNKARTILYVANTQSDTISIVDTASEKITATVMLRPEIAAHLAGATPTGLALSPDENTLYSSLGDMDAVAVIDVDDATPSVKGYIPGGWYPTSVAVCGGDLFVTNAKGDLPRVPHNAGGSTLSLLNGTLWKIAIPDKTKLATLTTQCLQDARLTPKYLNGEDPLQAVSLKAGNIKHVIYIVKENRTYDQVLGDMPKGNGDPSRCIFGRDVTPNQHALADRFVLFDNFYDCGEVSGDGWTWSTQAQANENAIRNVPYSYGFSGRAYDYAGTNNGYPVGGLPAVGPDGKPLSDDPRFKNGAPPIPDIDEPAGGHIWDAVIKQGLSYRNYGFFLAQGVYNGDATVIPDNYPGPAALQPGGHDLAGVTDVDFRDFDTSYPDSEATSMLVKKKNDPTLWWPTQTYGKSEATSRFAEWDREFKMMLAKDPTGNSIPAFMTVRLPNDHTGGGRSGSPSPRCQVADNDCAVGELVDAISHSPIWKSSAIIVLEDDAQSGQDHVDMHRSTCFLVSPWIKKGSVDSSFQSTISAIKTIECLLNVPPMCQYDAASDPLGGWDSTASNSEPYNAIIPSDEIMGQRGAYAFGAVSPEQGPARPTTRQAATRPTTQSLNDIKLDSPQALAAASDMMDFSHADRAPTELLNRIIWKTVRGIDSEPPPSPHGFQYGPTPKDDDDDN